MNFFLNLNTPLSVFAFLLALGVVFVNGFTDAPNAVATTVATKALSMNKACALCAIFNLLGLGCMSVLNMAVAKSIFDSADFAGKESVALCAVFISVIVFSVIAWRFSMPSSESHALISGIAGASFALSHSAELLPFLKIMLYMLISCIASFILSVLLSVTLTRSSLPFKKLQILSCAVASFMHGAQDGQKFVGILLFLAPIGAQGDSALIVILVSVALFLGTLLGGGRIVKAMGEGIVELNEKSAFISDLSSSICLLLCSLLGLAVSTSNIKACSIAGAGLADSKKVNFKSLLKMALVALITFPVCMALSYLCTRLLARL